MRTGSDAKVRKHLDGLQRGCHFRRPEAAVNILVAPCSANTFERTVQEGTVLPKGHRTPTGSRLCLLVRTQAVHKERRLTSGPPYGGHEGAEKRCDWIKNGAMAVQTGVGDLTRGVLVTPTPPAPLPGPYPVSYTHLTLPTTILV